MFKSRKMLVSICALISFFIFCAGSTYAEATKKASVTASALNMRKSPDYSAKVLQTLPKGSQLSILDESKSSWYKVAHGDTVGWVYRDYVTVKSSSGTSKSSEVSRSSSTASKGTISGSVVNLRSTASTSAKVLVQLDKGTMVSITGSSGNWYKVKTTKGTIGWILKSLISTKITSSSRGDSSSASRTSAKTAEEKPETPDKAQEIIAYAKKFLGVDYVWGGESADGFDCSGFTRYVYKKFGIDLEHYAASQATRGVKVSKSDLEAGDLVFFDTDGGNSLINHVGIYIGGGKFIHASSGGDRVMITDLTSGFYANSFMTARRVL